MNTSKQLKKQPEQLLLFPEYTTTSNVESQDQHKKEEPGQTPTKEPKEND